ncbi:SDR family oxidoreductase [Siccirubricoccus sp. KC 17139]|uniref:SDR family oxidoreductase n=1 Tax=Siccirubricoccus soli TaxID=2899147 RepID=A0ABT1D5Y4_9PROT|nr:SDR family oxidoreductase [Siccirubricoccus soli]MCO6417339.1 SDR family oxidoreductase [Siccirubricoccus soli]MCP2683474.1 SDR family oxidoreductase [Siccirubricoccus soli]
MQGISADLKGKVAIVTGAGSRPGEGVGNGRAAAILLARAGAKLVLADAVPEWAEETRRMIAEEGGEALTVTGDVTKPEDCAAIVAAATGRWGRLDALVNNVGISGPKGTAEEVDPEEWAHGLLVNVTSMMLMAKYAVPAMRAAGGGAIVNIGSVAGLKGGHPSLLYPTSKGAVVNMTRAMAVHHAKDRIRVNCVCPGMVYTPMVQAKGMSAEERERRRRRSILQVEGSGWDVGAAVAFLCSGNSRWMTGAIVPVDAGATAIAALPSG